MKPPGIPAILLLCFAGLAAGIIATGLVYHRHYEQQYRTEVEHQLQAIAHLKTDDLVQYRQERLGDGHILFNNPTITALAKRVLGTAAADDERRQLQDWFHHYRMHCPYDRVLLLDPGGTPRLSEPEGISTTSAVITAHLPAVLQEGTVALQDFYRSDLDGKPYLAVLVPLFDAQEGKRPLGAIVLRIDPETYLYPCIQRWPTSSRSAETLLVRRDGDAALFLNPLRFQPDAALHLRVAPADAAAGPALRAIAGEEGIVEDLDYRQVPVIAALRRIPDSPWSLIARMDAAEAFAPTREHLVALIGVIVSMLAAAAAALGMLWRQQRVRFYREQARLASDLRESENRLRFAMEGANDGLWDAQLATGLAYLSPRSREILGYGPDDRPTAPQLLNDLIHPEDLPLATQHLRDHLEGRAPLYQVENRMRTRAGTWVWVLSRGKVVERDGQGRPLRITGTHTDISERRAIKEELAGSVRRFRALFDNLTSGFALHEIILDAAGRPCDYRFLEINRAFESITGLSAASLIGRTVREALPGLEPEWIRRYGAVALGGGPIHFEQYAAALDRHYDVSAYAPVPGQFATIVLDVTVRKRAEEALLASEARFRRAIEHAPLPAILHAEDGEVQALSQTLTDLSGYARADLPRMADWVERAYGEHRTEMQLQIEALYGLETRKDDGEYEITCSDGSQRIWHFSSAPLGRLGDGRRAVITMALDITERRQAETRIRQMNVELEQRVQERTASLTAAIKELEAFSYSVSHDLRSPLRGIAGFSQILLEDHAARLDADGRRCLERISTAIERMGHLIDDLLRLSHISRKDIRLQQVDLSALAGAILGELRAADPQREVAVAIAPGLTAVADAGLARILLENLLRNAWKFTRKHPVATIEFGCIDDGGSPAFFLRDDGAGFDMRFADKLFGAFQRLHGASEFDGTGIGLAIVQRIINRHGGRVWAEAAIEQGATFFFTLPFTEAP